MGDAALPSAAIHFEKDGKLHGIEDNTTWAVWVTYELSALGWTKKPNCVVDIHEGDGFDDVMKRIHEESGGNLFPIHPL